MNKNITDKIKEIKEEKISSIISQYIKLKQAGNLYKAVCPFCDSRQSTFIVDDKKGIYYCSSDCSGGDAVSFILRLNNMTYEDLLRIK